MKYSVAVLLLIGEITIEESQAIDLTHDQSHFEQVFGKPGKKHTKGKKHHKKKKSKNTSTTTSDASSTDTNANANANGNANGNANSNSASSNTGTTTPTTEGNEGSLNKASKISNREYNDFQDYYQQHPTSVADQKRSWNEGMLHHVAADDYMSDTPAGYTSLQTLSKNMNKYDHWTQDNNDVSHNADYTADQPAEYAVEPLDLDAVQVRDEQEDPWTNENNDVSHNVDYVNDQPADYAVEPLDLDAVQLDHQIRYPHWTDQEHDKHSNVTDYQSNTPPDYLVEPLELPAALVQKFKAPGYISGQKYDHWTVQGHDEKSNAKAYAADSPQDYVVEPAVLPVTPPPALVQKYNAPGYISGQKYDHWTVQGHDEKSNAKAYAADAPQDYVVEPLELPAALAQGSTLTVNPEAGKAKYDHWTIQGHNEVSNEKAYAADAPQDFVVEPAVLPGALVQRKSHHRNLPDVPYTNTGGNVGTNGGDAVTGMVGNEDLGENAVVGGSSVSYHKQHHHAQTRTLPDTPYTNAGGNVGTNGGTAVEGMVGNEDLGENAVSVGGEPVKFIMTKHHAQKRSRTLPDTPYTNAGGNVGTNGGDAVTGMVGNEDLGENAVVGGTSVSYHKHHHHAQAKTLPDTPYTNAGGNVGTNGGEAVTGMAGDESLGENAVSVGGEPVSYLKTKLKHHAQKRSRTLPDTPYTNVDGNHGTNGGEAVDGMVGNEDLGENAVSVGGEPLNFIRQHKSRKF